MVSVFNSDDFVTFELIKKILREKHIQFIPKGDNTKGMKYVRFEIFVSAEYAARATEIIQDINENNRNSQDKFGKKHNPVIGYIVIGIILLIVVLLFALGLWIQEAPQ